MAGRDAAVDLVVDPLRAAAEQAHDRLLIEVALLVDELRSGDDERAAEVHEHLIDLARTEPTWALAVAVSVTAELEGDHRELFLDALAVHAFTAAAGDPITSQASQAEEVVGAEGVPHTTGVGGGAAIALARLAAEGVSPPAPPPLADALAATYAAVAGGVSLVDLCTKVDRGWV